jgi:hypothetical protein
MQAPVRWVAVGRMVAWVGLASVVAACGGPAGEGSTGPALTSTTTVATSTAALPSTSRPPAELPDLLVAHAGGVTQVGPGTDWYTGGAAEVAFPDHLGGLVFQRREAGDIAQLAAPGAEPSVLIGRTEPDRLALLDVFLLDGAPRAAYTLATRLPNDCPSDDVECLWNNDVTYLMLYDLGAGTTVNLGIIGSFESDWREYRFAADRYARAWTAYGEPMSCVGYGPVSELLPGASAGRWVPTNECRIGSPEDCPAGPLCTSGVRVAIGPGADTVVYTTGGENLLPLAVTTVDTGSGAVVGYLEVSGADGAATWVEFDGDRVLVGRRSGAGGDLPTLVVGRDGRVDQLEFAGRATFWK